jgi:hypothetical protein
MLRDFGEMIYNYFHDFGIDPLPIFTFLVMLDAGRNLYKYKNLESMPIKTRVNTITSAFLALIGLILCFSSFSY